MNVLFTNFRMQKSFASGLNLTKVQLNSFSICFCPPTLYSMSLSRWSNSLHSMANLYFAKYRSILYFPMLNWWIISSPLKACMICPRVSYSLHNHLLSWNSIPRHFVKFIKLGVGFLHLLITYKMPRLDKKTSYLFFWPLGQGQRLFTIALITLLVGISHLSRHSTDVAICLRPKKFPVWARLNKRFPSTSTVVSISFHKSETDCRRTSFLVLVGQKIVCVWTTENQESRSTSTMNYLRTLTFCSKLSQ